MTEQKPWAINLGPGPQPNDRERQLALDVVRAHHANGGTPSLLTSIAKALATYRLELRKEDLVAANQRRAE